MAVYVEFLDVQASNAASGHWRCIIAYRGTTTPDLMITLCLGHHAMVTRTQMLRKEWPELLRVLWREQHPEAHEQTNPNFAVKPVPVKHVPLFPEDRSCIGC